MPIKVHYCILVEEVMFSKMHSYKTSSAKISLSQVSLNRQCSRLQHKLRQICEGEERFLLTRPPVPHERRSRSPSRVPPRRPPAPALSATPRGAVLQAELVQQQHSSQLTTRSAVSSLAVAAAVCPANRRVSNFANGTSAESSRSRPGSENSLGNILDAKYTT